MKEKVPHLQFKCIERYIICLLILYAYFLYIYMHTNLNHITLLQIYRYVSNAFACSCLIYKLSHVFLEENYYGCLLCGSKLYYNH